MTDPTKPVDISPAAISRWIAYLEGQNSLCAKFVEALAKQPGDRRAAEAMREAAARLAEEETDIHVEGMSAVDVRLSIQRSPKWRDGRRIAAAIWALPVPDATPDPRLAMCMGVGDGSGQLFVYGDYDSIKAAQRGVIERGELHATIARLTAELEAARGERIQGEAALQPKVAAPVDANVDLADVVTHRILDDVIDWNNKHPRETFDPNPTWDIIRGMVRKHLDKYPATTSDILVPEATPGPSDDGVALTIISRSI